MLCPKCGAELPEGCLLCEKCGEEIQIVPDYDPLLDVKLGEEAEESQENKQQEPVSEKKTEEDIRQNKKSKKNKKKIFAIRVSLILLAVMVIGLIYLTQREEKRFQSLEYQLGQAEKYFGVGDYAKALEYYARAIELDDGDVSLLEKVADVYYRQNDEAWYEAYLRRIIERKDASEEQVRSAKEKLISLLVKKGDFQGINRLVLKGKDESLIQKYDAYLSPKPEFSLEEGIYYEMQSLQITVTTEKEGKIYYTLDGSTPGENASTYSLPILLEKGKTIVRACFINEYGVKSEIITGTYAIEDAPKEEPVATKEK